MTDDREPHGEVWWIYSDRPDVWAGLRIAHFGKSRSLNDKFEYVGDRDFFFILGEVPFRSGLRDWAEVSQREGWHKVRQIIQPDEAEIAAAMQSVR